MNKFSKKVIISLILLISPFISVLNTQSSWSKGGLEIVPYIAVESRELLDFAYSLFTIRNTISGKGTLMKMELNQQSGVGFEVERNLIFLSGRHLISDSKINLDRFPELGNVIRNEVSKIPVEHDSCIIQSFGSETKKNLVIIISSYDKKENLNDYQCLVLGTSHLFGLQGRIIDDYLSNMVSTLMGNNND